MSIFDWWIDKTIEKTITSTFSEKLPALIDAEIERQLKAKGIKLEKTDRTATK